MVMEESLITSNPVMVQKVCNGIVRAQHWVLGHREKTARILSRDGKGYLPADEETMLQVFTGYNPAVYGKGRIPEAIKHPSWGAARIGFQPYPYPSATRFIVEALGKTLMEGDRGFLRNVTPDYAVKDLVSYSFVKKAIFELGGPGKFPEMNLESPWDREEVIDV